jgi:hypothetical protein
MFFFVPFYFYLSFSPACAYISIVIALRFLCAVQITETKQASLTAVFIAPVT